MKIAINENEAQLVKLCKRGNTRAQFKLYKLYSKAMFNIAVRMTSNSEVAEDILQDAFIKAFSDMHRLKDERAFGGWLKKIVINRCIDVMRKERFFMRSLETVSEQHFEITDEVNEDFEPELIHHFIKKLPDGARQILVLRALEGYKHAEIGEQLGISESTVKTQFHRAKQLLGKMISEANNNENRKIFRTESIKS